MSVRSDKMKLGAFFHPTGNHVAAWLHPGAEIDAGVNFEHYARLAQTAERGKFDLMFLADAVATREGDPKSLRRWPQYMCFFDPLTLLAGLAAVTSRIGLVATATTSYNEPYNIARRLASIDHMSHGRSGWNVVTSSNTSEALNFGREEHYEHAERYERAVEFVEVVRGLMDSWDDDAFVRDRDTAIYYDPDKLHTLHHRGKHFTVRGPLNTARPPQGFPVIAQATQSGRGMDIAAEIAEILFTPLSNLDQAKAFYAQIKGMAVAKGRSAEDLKVMPGLNPIVASTEGEAQAKRAELTAMIHDDVGRAVLFTAMGEFDLSDYPSDKPLPEEVLEIGLASGRGEAVIIADLTRKGMTLRQVYQQYASARGQNSIVGTPEQIADHMEAWFQARGVDGFLIQPSVLPLDLDIFVDTVIPVLQARGLFRTEYEGETLRENLGLPRPASRYAQVEEPALVES